jgi:hypothetical protein
LIGLEYRQPNVIEPALVALSAEQRMTAAAMLSQHMLTHSAKILGRGREKKKGKREIEEKEREPRRGREKDRRERPLSSCLGRDRARGNKRQ